MIVSPPAIFPPFEQGGGGKAREEGAADVALGAHEVVPRGKFPLSSEVQTVKTIDCFHHFVLPTKNRT